MQAAGELLMTQGFHHLSHRSVARHADVSLSATTYYFTSLDSLIEAAVHHLAEHWLTAAKAEVDALPEHIGDVEQLARALIQLILSPTMSAGTAEAGAALSLYDRYLEAARRPHLQPIVAAYDTEIEALIGTVLERGATAARPDHARILLAVIDGALVRCYAEGLPPSSAAATVSGVLRLLDSADT